MKTSKFFFLKCYVILIFFSACFFNFGLEFLSYRWHRVRIQSQNEDNSLTVFYVDFGDSENVTLAEIKCIPEWAITQLPFQVIKIKWSSSFFRSQLKLLLCLFCRQLSAVLPGYLLVTQSTHCMTWQMAIAC